MDVTIRMGILLLAWLGLAWPVQAAQQVRAWFQYQALHLEFAQPMQVWDNDRALDVRLEPALPLQCAWHSDTLVVCSPNGEPGPAVATRYRIRLPGTLRTQDGSALPALAVEAETARPMVHAQVEGWDRGLPRIVVSSQYPVDAAGAARVLRLERDGVPMDVAWQALPPRGPWDSGARFRPDLPTDLPSDSHLALRVLPGLRWAQGPLPGRQDEVLLQALAKERFRLRSAACGGRKPVRGVPRNGVLALPCLAGEPVALLFSAHPDEMSRARLANALPPGAELTGWQDHPPSHAAGPVVARAPGVAASVSIEADNRPVSFALPADMRAEADGGAIEPAVLHLLMGDRRPMLSAPHPRRLLADGSQLPVLAQAVNAPPHAIGVEGIGARARAGLAAISSVRSNTPAQPQSPETEHTLAEGGWVRWTPAPADRERSWQRLEFAAPDFDLYALAARREVLAWANHWAGDAAVAGAEVELLWRMAGSESPQILARARTGPDGVARLRLPEDFARRLDDGNGDPISADWWLRATRGRGRRAERAVLPGTAAVWSRSALGQAEEIRRWGVADRPLYRAGDTVRYRLWQRRASGGRLLAVADPPPLELQLHDLGEGKTIRRWQAAADSHGGISGELALPIHLTDGTYCIGTPGRGTEGACFFVGTYRAHDLWVEAETEDRVLRDGDVLALEVEAGYYSGGPAATVDLDRVSTSLVGLPLERAYPQYRDYTFIDVSQRGASGRASLAVPLRLPTGLDGDGRARLELPIVFAADDHEPPAFGELQLVAEARASDREGAASNATRARYARYGRYVGLRVTPRWLDAAMPVRMQGVVIDAEGRTIVGAEVEVEAHYLPAGGTDRAPILLQRCRLPPGVEVVCDFPRERSGSYRLTARSGDAAAAELTRYVWTGSSQIVEVAQPSIELLEAPEQPGGAVRVLVRQPYARGRALLVFEHGDALLGYRAVDLDGNVQELSLETDPDWPVDVSLSLHARERVEARVEGALRFAPQPQLAHLSLKLVPRRAAAAPVGLRFDAAAAEPGRRVGLTVRNDSDEVRDVVVAVTDDGLRGLAGDLLARFDPHGDHWLGASSESAYGSLLPVSFAGWNHGAPWRYPLPWPSSSPEERVQAPCEQLAEGARAACEAAMAAAGGAGAAAPPEEPPVVFDAPSPIDAPAPPAPLAYAGASLDRVEVTGSRVALPSPSDGGTRASRNLRPDQRPLGLEARARVRTRFLDSAFWLPDLRLAPGEARRLEIELPDNLTRWRAIAWSSDTDDGFAMAQATLEAGLPLEARLQTPVRIYPGDRARLAANVRQSGEIARTVQAGLRVEGLETAHDRERPLSLAARGQASFGSEIAPVRPGLLRVTATASAGAQRDAVAAPIEVASPRIAARRVQAGWLGEASLSLELPQLPAGAERPRLQVSLHRGGAGLVERWTEDLRAFPHRCWEQILSRAVAAALAIERGDVAAWPDAEAVVREALDNAAVFQTEAGDFRFFAESVTWDEPHYEPRPQVALTAYTVRMFALLRELGHAVPSEPESNAKHFLEEGDFLDDGAPGWNEQALAAEALAERDPDGLAELWGQWEELALPARIALASVLAQSGHRTAGQAIGRLLDAAPARGPVRVLAASDDAGRWMGSRLREQCALISLLQGQTQLADAGVRRALLAGLTDLYAGGVQAVDTQTGAYCLLALRGLAASAERERPEVAVRLGDVTSILQLASGEDRADWQTDDPRGSHMHLQTRGRTTVPSSFVAELHYEEDARQARPSAVGLAIGRRYAVLRAGGWQPLDGAPVREGDWVRITLVIDNGAVRHFVAISDAVPGGLQPTDLALGAIAGLDLERVSDTGSWWFGTRRLDPRTPRFYAEILPPGRHEVHYFARAGNAGDYLAAPALAELMYGHASHARTAASRLLIESAAEER